MSKITLFLMTQKGYEVLRAIVDANLQSVIAKVVAGRDNQIENDFFSEIKDLCSYYKIDFYENRKEIQLNSEFALAVSWRWIIPENKLTTLLVIHDSLLPKYRGFAPLVNMLINGESSIGITAIKACNEYDRGPITFQEKITISYPITIQDAINRIAKLYANVAVQIARTIANNEALVFADQDETQATYSLWRDEEDYIVDWNKDANFIKRFIDAVGSPYKGAVSFIENRKVIIHEVEVMNDLIIENRDVGKVIFIEDQKPIVVCGLGLIKILKLTDEEGQSLLPLKKFRIRFKKQIT